jgi:hypothetical protein
MVNGSAMVNHYYFYGVDADFGPFFLTFCSYASALRATAGYLRSSR